MGQLKDICITDLEDDAPVDVVEILVQAGEAVEVDQPLATLETDKALVEFPSPHAGVVGEIHVQPGDQMVQGDSLLALKLAMPAPDSKSSLPDAQPAPASPESAPDPRPVPAPAESTSRAYASPAMYRYARELGVSLERVQGSGRGLRVLKEDIEQHVRTRLQSPSAPSASAPAPLPDVYKYGDTEEAPLPRIQRLPAENLL
ncbi:MAG: pyruvate dehydrogenase complex dihydrolipoyllysine-residue acetyltransferase, partial [Proteobacteria bacterium]|nr:pyruvate dehydrogenase complex dihydrolipoyllysine-residue acetyltransferase [Pseudomonadota bacterium]